MAMTKFWKGSRILAFAWILPLALAAGCGDDDDSNTTVDQGTAQQQALGVVELNNEMLATVDEVVAGDFSAISATLARRHEVLVERAEPIWNDGEGRWELAETFSGPEGRYEYFFTIQFLNGSGNPQQEPDDTTARTVYGLVFDLDAIAAQDGDNLNIDLHYVNAMDITNLNTPVYDVEGGGELLGSIDGVQNGRRVEYVIDMSWAVDAEVPEDGSCGTGTVVVTVEPYTLVATYSAPTQTYAWTFSQGDNVISSGTGTAPCATAVRQPDLFQVLGINP
jgi:hypothetical protein